MIDWVLITGASSGIGLELAKCFAADQFNLILTARNEARLNRVADELRAQHGIQTKVIAKDLALPGAAQEIFDALRDTPVSILVNNAGFGLHGLFAKIDLREQTDLLQVNMTALVQLTHLFLQPMLASNRGRIMNVASTAAFQPGPTINVYFASKAFVYSFSYALAEELTGTNVTVTTLCPGTTRTEFFARGNFGPVRGRYMMDAAKVARIGYRGLMNGKRVVIPGLLNKLAAAISKRMPDRVTAYFVRKLHKY
jgi:short-subunit dehydrogenase